MVIEDKGLKDRHLPISQRACDRIGVYLEEVRPKFVSIESGDAIFLCDNGLRVLCSNNIF